MFGEDSSILGSLTKICWGYWSGIFSPPGRYRKTHVNNGSKPLTSSGIIHLSTPKFFRNYWTPKNGTPGNWSGKTLSTIFCKGIPVGRLRVPCMGKSENPMGLKFSVCFFLNVFTTPWWFKVTFLGWLSDPFKGLSDLQLGYKKVTAWITWPPSFCHESRHWKKVSQNSQNWMKRRK